MTEEPPTKNLKIIIDRTEEIKSKDAKIEELNQEIGKREEIIKEYMKNDAEAERKKAEYVTDRKPAPMGDPQDTAPLETQVQTIKIDEASEILDFVRFKSPEEACNFLKECASNPHRGDYKFAQQLYGKAVKKILRENGSWQFEGNLSKWERRGSKVVKADRKHEFRKVVD